MEKFLISIIILLLFSTNVLVAQDAAIGKYTSNGITYNIFMLLPQGSNPGTALVRYNSKGNDKLVTYLLKQTEKTINDKQYVFFESLKAKMLEGTASYTSESFLFDKGDITTRPLVVDHDLFNTKTSLSTVKSKGILVENWKLYKLSKLNKNLVKPFFPVLSSPIYELFQDKEDIAKNPFIYIKSEFEVNDIKYYGFIMLHNMTKKGIMRVIYTPPNAHDAKLIEFNINGEYVTKQGNQYLMLVGNGQVTDIYTKNGCAIGCPKRNRPVLLIMQNYKPDVFLFPVDDIKTKPFLTTLDILRSSKTPQELLKNGIAVNNWKVIDRTALSEQYTSPQNKPYRFFPWGDDFFNELFHDAPYSKIKQNFIKISSSEIKYILSSFTIPYKNIIALKESENMYVSSIVASGSNTVVTLEKTPAKVYNNVSGIKNLKLSYLQDNRSEGFKINEIAYDGEKQYFISSTKNPKRGDQGFINSTSDFTQGKYRETLKEKLKLGYTIITLAPLYVKRNSKINLTAIIEKDILGVSDQEILSGLDEFPIKEIKEYQGKNYNITTALYYKNKWYVVMTQYMGITNQEYKIAKEYPFKWVEENLKKGLNITTSCWGPDGWLVVMSKGRLIDKS